jgi:C4-dicarboxylate-specific signal transduction histidine kinase
VIPEKLHAAPLSGTVVRAATDVDFRAVFEQSDAPCLLLSADAPRFSVVSASDAYLAMVRSSSAACAGGSLLAVLSGTGVVADEAELETLHAALAAAIEGRCVTRVRVGGTARPSPAQRVRSEPGTSSGHEPSRPWTVVSTPVCSAEGEVSHVLQRFERADTVSTAGGDVDQLLAERTRELAAASAELEAFSYSVAHDLRAPLRAIDGFSQALMQDHAASLSVDASGYLEHIRAGAQRMSALLDDMLELSRIQRTPLRKAALDVSQLAHRIVDGLRQSSPDRVVAVDIAPRLRVHADSHLTAVLLEKLLGNAWKFTSKNARASIQLGREPSSDAPTLFVSDDGVGFDMTCSGRLFSPFQRLHKASDFDGTGMGLAIAHRIVARHGGRIWAQAEVGKGARFNWTVELAPDAAR